MRVVVRAFNEEGYHKDIAIISEKQVHMNNQRCGDPIGSLYSGLLGYGVSINPKDFPEMVKFEVVVEIQK